MTATIQPMTITWCHLSLLFPGTELHPCPSILYVSVVVGTVDWEPASHKSGCGTVSKRKIYHISM